MSDHPVDATNMIAADWQNWSSARPVAAGLYWWRVDGHKYPGTEGTAEWVDELCWCGMGHSDNELWPIFSNWNGHTRNVPKGLQWKPCAPGLRRHHVAMAALPLQGCPFCGGIPQINFKGSWIGAPPLHAEYFYMKCACGRSESGRFSDIGNLARRWNERHTTAKDARIAELEARILELETVTDEKVERAAKAARQANWKSSVPMDPWESLHPSWTEHWLKVIRAALMAGR